MMKDYTTEKIEQKELDYDTSAENVVKAKEELKQEFEGAFNFFDELKSKNKMSGTYTKKQLEMVENLRTKKNWKEDSCSSNKVSILKIYDN